MVRSLGGAMLMLATLPLVAQAHGWHAGYVGPAFVPAYYGVPVYPVVVRPAPFVPMLAPACAALPVYAVPQAAPPSAPSAPTSAPSAPPAKPMPPADSGSRRALYLATSGDTGSFYDVYPVASAGREQTADRYAVSFWNLSPSDLVMTVAGEAAVVPRGGRTRLQLGEKFVWQIEGREARTEHAPANAVGLEIVIRR